MKMKRLPKIEEMKRQAERTGYFFQNENQLFILKKWKDGIGGGSCKNVSAND